MKARDFRPKSVPFSALKTEARTSFRTYPRGNRRRDTPRTSLWEIGGDAVVNVKVICLDVSSGKALLFWNSTSFYQLIIYTHVREGSASQKARRAVCGRPMFQVRTPNR